MNPTDIPMTAPTLVPVARSAFRADLLEAAEFFLRSPDVAQDFRALVGDVMMDRAEVAVAVGELADRLRAEGRPEAGEIAAAQLAYARAVLADEHPTPGRKMQLLREAFDAADLDLLGEFARLEPAPAPAPAPEAETLNAAARPERELLLEAWGALQHMTLGQQRLQRLSPSLLDRIEAALSRMDAEAA